MSNKKVGIYLFETFHGRKNVGSSRIRGKWLDKYWDESELFQYGRKYEVVIYQKVYDPKHAKAFNGIKILSLCDPDFLWWQYQTVEMMEEVDAIVTSTEELAIAIRNFTDKPVICIPDRLDLEFHKGRKFHQDKARTVIWYGYSSGFDMLKGIPHFLTKYNLNLTVISNKGYYLSSQDDKEFKSKGLELTNYPWTLETVNHDIMTGDIVINPQQNRGKWKYKSNNKTIKAWALGMPVANDPKELERFLDPEERNKEAKKRIQEIKDNYNITKSVQEFKTLIEQIKNEKK